MKKLLIACVFVLSSTPSFSNTACSQQLVNVVCPKGFKLKIDPMGRKKDVCRKKAKKKMVRRKAICASKGQCHSVVKPIRGHDACVHKS